MKSAAQTFFSASPPLCAKSKKLGKKGSRISVLISKRYLLIYRTGVSEKIDEKKGWFRRMLRGEAYYNCSGKLPCVISWLNDRDKPLVRKTLLTPTPTYLFLKPLVLKVKGWVLKKRNFLIEVSVFPRYLLRGADWTLLLSSISTVQSTNVLAQADCCRLRNLS